MKGFIPIIVFALGFIAFIVDGHHNWDIITAHGVGAIFLMIWRKQ